MVLTEDYLLLLLVFPWNHWVEDEDGIGQCVNVRDLEELPRTSGLQNNVNVLKMKAQVLQSHSLLVKELLAKRAEESCPGNSLL